MFPAKLTWVLPNWGNWWRWEEPEKRKAESETTLKLK